MAVDWDDDDRDGLLRWYFGGEPPDTEPGLPGAEPGPQGERAALAATPGARRIRVLPAPAPVPVRESEPQRTCDRCPLRSLGLSPR